MLERYQEWFMSLSNLDYLGLIAILYIVAIAIIVGFTVLVEPPLADKQDD